MIIIINQDAYHLAFDARGDRRNSRGKKQPSFLVERYPSCIIQMIIITNR
jgi:hypothetical protein